MDRAGNAAHSKRLGKRYFRSAATGFSSLSSGPSDANLFSIPECALAPMSCIADTRVATGGVALVSSMAAMVRYSVLSVSSVLARQKKGSVAWGKELLGGY